MASYTVNQQALARARQLIDARQYAIVDLPARWVGASLGSDAPSSQFARTKRQQR